MEHIFVSVYTFFERNKTAYWALLICLIATLCFFASQIKLEEDITQMLPFDEKTERSNRILSNTKFLDKLVVRISQRDTNANPNPDALIYIADKFIEALNKPSLKPHLEDIQARIDEDAITQIQDIIYKNLPFFLSASDYTTIDTLIAKSTIETTMLNNYKLLVSPASMLLKQSIIRDPIGITNLGLAKFKSLQPDNQYELYDGYVLSKGQKSLLIFLTSAHPPNETSGNALLIDALNSEIKSLAESDKAIEVVYFGTPAVAVANATQIKKDIAFTLTIALILILFLLWFYFRNLLVLPFILLPALFGAVFALAIIYFIKAKISVIALGAGTIVLGVAVDYSLHILVHYKHTKSMATVVKDVSVATLVGCITTVGAFFCLLFVKAQLLQDFGLFAGFTLLGAALFSLIFLPQLIKILYTNDKVKPNAILLADTLSSFKIPTNKYGKIWITVILSLTLLFVFTSRYAGFESDMSKMNYMSPQLKTAEKQIITENAGGERPLYLIFNGKNTNDALENSQKTISNIQSHIKTTIVYAGVSDILISENEQKKRLALWNNYWTAEKKQSLNNLITQNANKLGFKANTFNDFSQLLNENFHSIDSQSLITLKKKFLKDFVNESEQGTTLLTIVKIGVENRESLVNLLENDPNVVIADKQNLTARFVEIINSELNIILTLSSVLVFLILLISYGRIELAMLTFIPMLITWIWILGLMGIFGIKFNLINIIISTFIFGLGDDYAIFISDGLLNEYKTGKKHLPSFTISILLSAVTTIIGVGVLIFATHPAIQSIALISVIGILCTVAISFTILPFLFNWLLLNRKKAALAPITLLGLFYSTIAYCLFLLGCILLNVVGFILFSGLSIKARAIKLGYHYLLMYATKIMSMAMVNVKKQVINAANENFSKPSIIISNHQSYVDIILMLTLHPKLILVTNEWVWNSPFFGNIVRHADFQSISHTMEDSFLKLSQKVNEGYSIVIFPEGTRSYNGEIMRFHKGAFYLAEKLNLDIVPILIHGTGDIINKNDFIVNSGSITLEILPRILPQNQAFGIGYASISKEIKKYFANRFAMLKEQVETPRYFSSRLLANYIYKGPVLEWYSKIKLRMEHEYSLVQSYVPMKASIVDIGCGYGFLAYLLNYKSKEREILGIDYDAEKIEVANYCHSKTDRVNFVCADISTFHFTKSDVFILMDVLHYMEIDLQEKLINNCLQNLNENGIIIIRDADAAKVEKHKTVVKREFFATQIGFNKSVDNKLHFVSSDVVCSIVEANNASVEKIQFGKQTSNTVYIIRKK